MLDLVALGSGPNRDRAVTLSECLRGKNSVYIPEVLYCIPRLWLCRSLRYISKKGSVSVTALATYYYSWLRLVTAGYRLVTVASMAASMTSGTHDL
jgi:hypothetical protein